MQKPCSTAKNMNFVVGFEGIGAGAELALFVGAGVR